MRPTVLPHALVFLAAFGLPALCAAAVYHVSPAGDDANTGLSAAAALRTLQTAVDRLQPGDTLLLHGGVYRETVVFPRSGEPDRPITLKPFNDEPVTITGCDAVTGWTVHDADKGIWKAPMPWTLGTGRNQAFAGGDVLLEARFPNEPGPDLEMYVAGLSPLWPTWGEFSIPTETKKEQPGRIVSKLLDGQPDDYWKGALYEGVHFEGWCAQTGVIESSKSGEISVGDRTSGWWFGSAYGGGNPDTEEGRGMIVGHMNALDQPGEWHWQDDTLYLIPRDGREPMGIEAKARQLAFDLSSRENIHITGLDITAASMRLHGSANCVVDGCRLTYITHFIRQYGIGDVEHGRDTMRSGETGIWVSGHDNSFLNCSVRFSAGAGFYLRGYHHTIHNCLIDEVSYTAHYLNAITDAVGDYNDYENFLVGGHVITYNTMRNAGRHFFNFYGNGTSSASRTRGPMDYMATLFAHNHLYNGMLITRDAGFITGYYTSGGTLNGLNSQVVYNTMHDCYDLAAMQWGVLGIVYLDAGTCDVDLHHNLLWAAPGTLQRGLWYNTMCVDVHERDNTFHKLFTRTSADLKPDDFPEGRPFRFGHDFANPPPATQWPPVEGDTVQVETCAAQSPGVVKSETGLSGLMDGDWFALDGVDFDQGWQSAVLRLASDATQMNTDRSARARPRHQKATDPLVMEVSANDGLADGIRRQWTFMWNVSDGGWIRFNQAPLGEGYRRFRAIYGNDQPEPRTLEVRLDAVDGPLVGQISLPQTDVSRGGRIQIYAEAVGEISADATGTHDVFLVLHSPDGKNAGEFEYFRFEQCRGQIPLQKNEVKLELRLGSPEGEKIGEFYPRPTGGPDTFSEFVANLEPAQGTQRLCVVVRSALDCPIGTLDSLTLQKAQPAMPDVYAPPLMRDGKMVLPEATNLPQARPADKYAGAKAAARPRAMHSAVRLQDAPEVDGDVQEWAALGEPMLLAEDPYTMPSSGLSSKAWIAYDDEAIYVAADHPVKDVGKLSYAEHLWGATDAMEIAFQDAFGEKPGLILNLYGWPDGHMVSTPEAGAPAGVVKRLQDAVAYRAAIGPDGWSCEWRIPFAACGFTPQTAPQLLLNLGVRKEAEGAWVVWQGTGGPTHKVGNAGVLLFPAELAAGGAVPREKLAVWLDAADADTVERDEQGKVALWEDRSGTDHDARQDAPAFRPLYVADALNGKPALRFSEDAKTRLELPDLSDEKIAATVFAVFSNPEPGLEVNHDARIFTSSDGTGFDYQVGLAATIPGMTTGGPRQSMWVFRDRWAKAVRVGCFSPNPQTFFKGDLAEVLVYTRELPRDEQDRVRAYLMTKWGL